MRKRNLKRLSLIFIATLSVNIMVFTGLPNLLPRQTVENDVSAIQAVNFIRQKENPAPDNDKSAQEKPKPPEPPRTVARKMTNALAQPAHQQLQMEMPAFNFDLPTDMAMGAVVEAPVVQSQNALKDFYGMSDVDQAPVATLKTRPIYPYRARRLNLDGEVDIKFLVDTTGRVSRISILRAAPPGLFDESVLKALSAWQFSPGKVKGRPVNTWVTTTIAFRIDDL